jgi:ERF superfamily
MPELPPAEPCKTLAEALAALQARLPRVAKEHKATVTSQRTGKTHSYDYADLLDVSDALLPVLSSLGLSFSACPTLRDDGKFVLRYKLRHISGESDGGDYPLPASGSPQEIGSAISYARRYSLIGVTGLAPGGDDDDGQGAEQEHQQRLRQPVSAQDRERAKTTHLKAGTSRLARAQEEDPWAQDAPVDGQRASAIRGSMDPEFKPGSSIPPQHQQLGILYGQIGITERASRLGDMTDRMGRVITSAKDLSYAEAESAIRDLRELAKAGKDGGS